MRAAVLIPVKDFAAAKRRLADALSPEQRAALAEHMAARVIAAARGLPVYVVCDSETVAAFARHHGAHVMWRPGLGLNGAVADGLASLTGHADRVIIAHGDLPLADDLRWVATFPGATIVPDRRDDGTNVMCLAPDAPIEIAYGPGSFQRHVQSALGAGISVRVVRDPRLGWDVDLPEDLSTVTAWTSPANPR